MGSDRDVDRFDAWASSYDNSPLQRIFFVPIHARMLAAVRREKPDFSPADIVDVGCGTGRLLHAASGLWPSARIAGVDPAEGMIAQAARLNPRASFKLAQAEALPLGDESADLVMSSLSFHHWGDQGQGLREIRRILRRGGLFVLADHSFRLAGGRARSRSQLRRMFEASGFTVRAQRRAGLPFLSITLGE